jgi:hypothetical protein
MIREEKTKDKTVEQAVEHIAWLFLELIDEKNKKVKKKSNDQ